MAQSRSQSPACVRADPVSAPEESTVAVTVRSAADGGILLSECVVSRKNCIQQIELRLLQAKGKGFSCILFDKHTRMNIGDVLHGERVELSVVFQTKYQINEYFQGLECERPVGPGFIPDGSRWMPGRFQGEYKLEWSDAADNIWNDPTNALSPRPLRNPMAPRPKGSSLWYPSATNSDTTQSEAATCGSHNI